MPPGTGKQPATGESGAPEQDTKDRCEDYYNRCVEAGGDTKPGRVYDQSICGTCMAYCKVHGFWPEAIYNWNQVRIPCPGI
ncbi:hypothetical protein ATI61_101571 [Archangium gephyra]|uniref:Lipoprotein n=1 Tax=Archangium gephyra TaxID=48 RepID=A0ABX9KBS6_9BACT|nr:hypothetical protein ATI61_101571 [Archangium gephyra]